MSEIRPLAECQQVPLRRGIRKQVYLGMELKTVHMLHEYSTTESLPQFLTGGF